MQYGRTLLHYAAEGRKYDVVALLLESNADANSKDKVAMVILGCLFRIAGNNQYFRNCTIRD